MYCCLLVLAASKCEKYTQKKRSIYFYLSILNPSAVDIYFSGTYFINGDPITKWCHESIRILFTV